MLYPPFDDALYPEMPASERTKLFEILREDAICLTICGTFGVIVATLAIADFFRRHPLLRLAVTIPPVATMVVVTGVYDALTGLRLKT